MVVARALATARLAPPVDRLTRFADVLGFVTRARRAFTFDFAAEAAAGALLATAASAAGAGAGAALAATLRTGRFAALTTRFAAGFGAEAAGAGALASAGATGAGLAALAFDWAGFRAALGAGFDAALAALVVVFVAFLTVDLPQTRKIATEQWSWLRF